MGMETAWEFYGRWAMVKVALLGWTSVLLTVADLLKPSGAEVNPALVTAHIEGV
jgi:hypothetical protein